MQPHNTTQSENLELMPIFELKIRPLDIGISPLQAPTWIYIAASKYIQTISYIISVEHGSLQAFTAQY